MEVWVSYKKLSHVHQIWKTEDFIVAKHLTRKKTIFSLVSSGCWERKDGTWERLQVYVGGEEISGNLVGEDRAIFITSFGENENGKTKSTDLHR